MIKKYFENQSLHIAFGHVLEPGEYDNCHFTNSDLSNADLSEYVFIDCTFLECNLSNIKCTNTGFKNVFFETCKMLGVQFTECNPFQLKMQFMNCNLQFSSLYKCNIPGTPFKKCNLEGADFTMANISKSIFDQCQLGNAVFDKTNIEYADFYTSFNFNIDPEINMLYKAKFDAGNLSGLLVKYNLDIVGIE